MLVGDLVYNDDFDCNCNYDIYDCYPDVPNCTAEALFMRIKDDIKDKFFKNEEISYHLYKGLEDFCIGGQLRPEDIQKD